MRPDQRDPELSVHPSRFVSFCSIPGAEPARLGELAVPVAPFFPGWRSGILQALLERPWGQTLQGKGVVRPVNGGRGFVRTPPRAGSPLAATPAHDLENRGGEGGGTDFFQLSPGAGCRRESLPFSATLTFLRWTLCLRNPHHLPTAAGPIVPGQVT